jgi:uncharacterized protein (TIGR02246 family)
MMLIDRRAVISTIAFAAVVLAAVLLAASVSLSGEPDAGTTLSTAKNPDLGIDQTYKEWFGAVTRGDSATLVSLITPDAEFWTHGAPPLKGRDAVKTVLDKFYARFSVEQRFFEVERQIFGKWAFIRGLEVTTLKPRAGGEPTEHKQRGFSILRLEPDGRWRFARGMTNQGPIEASK